MRFRRLVPGDRRATVARFPPNALLRIVVFSSGRAWSTKARVHRGLSRSKLVRLVALWLFGLFLMAWSKPAAAYSWMIRHEYTSCQTCHLDPSGAGVLTLYGRAQSEVLLRTRYGHVPDDEDPTKLGGFLFGAVKLPEQVMLQADLRSMFLAVKPPAPTPWQARYVLMQADAAAGISASRFRAAGRLGVVSEGANGASFINFSSDQNDAKLVSREYWAGVALGKDNQFLLRAGRMNLPFGLRILEHTMWVRSSTRTDINAAQQHGVAFAFTDEHWRAEVMGIAGNFQLRPIELHEYGYAGYLERAFGAKLAAGVSSMVTYTPKEIASQAPTFRHAHGLFARYTPAKALVLSAEIDMLLRSPKTQAFDAGGAVFIQADVEPTQGLHLIGTLETQDVAFAQGPPSYGAWLGAMWFFMPHMDVRVDAIMRDVAVGETRTTVPSLLAQFHAFL